MFDSDKLVQLVTENGKRRHESDYSKYVSDIDVAAMRKLYEDLVIVRRIDFEATSLQRQGELGLWAPLLGQEAAQVGSARAMQSDDFVFPSYREHGVAYCRGVDPAKMLHMWRGTAHSGWDPYEYNMNAPAIIVGAQGLHAVGYAMGLQFDSAASASIAYFGDGASSQGDISEALGFAASFAAPVVFFCQNNQWAISEPVALQTHGTIAQRGRGYGMPAVRVDGNDVLAVLAVTRAALEHARDGGGPVLIEAVTYRMGPHTTSDDPKRYRDGAHDDEWRDKDPIDRVRKLLAHHGQFGDDFVAEVNQKADDVAALLRAGCINAPDPAPLDIFDHVYADPHPLVDDERRQLERYLSTLEGSL